MPPKAKCPSCMAPLDTKNVWFFANCAFCRSCVCGYQSELRHPAPIATTMHSAIQPAHLFTYRGILWFTPRLAIAVPFCHATPAQLKILMKPELLPNTVKLLQP